MNRILTAANLVVVAGFVLTTGLQASSDSLKQATYSIEGPFCSGCVGLLQEVAQQVDGVRTLDVDPSDWLVKVTFDAASTSADAIREHVNAETRFELLLVEVTEAVTSTSVRRLICC